MHISLKLKFLNRSSQVLNYPPAVFSWTAFWLPNTLSSQAGQNFGAISFSNHKL